MFSIQNTTNISDWDKYLSDLDKYLKGLGFGKYNQTSKGEDYAYWISHGDQYQVGILVYDWRKHLKHTAEKKVSLLFECMLTGISGRCYMVVSKEIELPEFEKMSETFYESMINYFD